MLLLDLCFIQCFVYLFLPVIYFLVTAIPVLAMAFGVAMFAPVCLIENDGFGKLSVKKQAKDILDRIIEPVVVVSVVGPHRTGKSYLVNLLAGLQTGFSLGYTIESETKGIWMWCIPHPTKKGHTLVLLDTEGLGDVQEKEKNDKWIFCLAVLLSSVLVYNSLGVIDDEAVEKLHYVTELPENIRVKAEGDEDESAEFMHVFPSFVWAVQDFDLEFEIEDEWMTSDEYLESALKLKKGHSLGTQRYNLPRRCLCEFFAQKKCFLFPRPAYRKYMRRLEDLSDETLDSRFLHQAHTFCSYIYDNAQPKTVRGHTITGTALGNLAEIYVEAISSGNVICLENAVVSLAKIQNVRAVDQARQIYKEEMLRMAQPPLDPDQLSRIHTLAEEKAIKVFINMSFSDKDQIYQKELMEKIHHEYQHMCLQNHQAFLMQCRKVLEYSFYPLELKISDGSYLRPGGYRQYRALLNQLISDYRARTESQIKHEEALWMFLQGKEDVGNQILQADESLSAAEQEKEVQILKNEILQQHQRGLEEQKHLEEQIIQQMKRNQEKIRRDDDQALKAKHKHEEASWMIWKGNKDVGNKIVQADESLSAVEQEKEGKSLGSPPRAESSTGQPTSESAEEFTPELIQTVDEDKHKNTYRFVSPHAGQFQCSLTSLVFVMDGEGEVLYRVVSWDPRLLDGLGQIQPVGPLYDIDCFNGSISRLHLPHCEIFSEGDNMDGLAVAHFTAGNIEIIQPIKVTETHVMIDIRDLSLFGLLWMKIFSPPISGQVLLFLRTLPVEEREKILNVHLLPGNIPVPEVQLCHRDKKYIETTSKCQLFFEREYSLCCQPENFQVQPTSEIFDHSNFGPNYHPTFEVFLGVHVREVGLAILDKAENGREVWSRQRILLTAPSQGVEPPEHRMISGSEFVDALRGKLIQRVSSVMAIADSLRSKHMITDELYSELHNADTNQRKMRCLFMALDSGGASVKAEFYRLLKKNEPHLVEELESGHSKSFRRQ
eukprot:XP_021334239.1 caspase recruitment domain-containing protein 8 isoform X2 [Danio rerio]